MGDFDSVHVRSFFVGVFNGYVDDGFRGEQVPQNGFGFSPASRGKSRDDPQARQAFTAGKIRRDSSDSADGDGIESTVVREEYFVIVFGGYFGDVRPSPQPCGNKIGLNREATRGIGNFTIRFGQNNLVGLWFVRWIKLR